MTTPDVLRSMLMYFTMSLWLAAGFAEDGNFLGGTPHVTAIWPGGTRPVSQTLGKVEGLAQGSSNVTENRKQPGGQPAGQWAQQQKQSLKRQDEQAVGNQARRVVEGGEKDQQNQQGDNRTPDETIGEIAYANRNPAEKTTGEF